MWGGRGFWLGRGGVGGPEPVRAKVYHTAHHKHVMSCVCMVVCLGFEGKGGWGGGMGGVGCPGSARAKVYYTAHHKHVMSFVYVLKHTNR